MSRLDRAEWLDFALGELARAGHNALKAQTLAAGLGVTRGSFYWHFEDLDDFKHALVAHWADRTSEGLLQVQAPGEDAEAQLAGLMDRAFSAAPGLERAMRAWATVDPHVAGHVAAVDWRRVRLAEKLLASLHVAPEEVGPRARLLYWAAIGRIVMARPARRDLSPRDVSCLARLIARPDGPGMQATPR